MTHHSSTRGVTSSGPLRAAFSAAAALALLASSPACGIDSFRLSGGDRDDAGVGDAGVLDDGGNPIVDARPIDAPIDACVPDTEVCDDGVDNDCDTMVDEFNSDDDPSNCGACGNVCSRIKAAGTCNTGACEYECLPGFYDLDGDLLDPLGNGCEYGPCIITAALDDVCNLADEDCDGVVDEDVDLLGDADNCSMCGNVCTAINADPFCNSGVCDFTCLDGYLDTVPNIAGCEYQCPVYPPVAETCNNLDEDCDTIVDEGAGTGAACTDPGYETYGDTGECAFGTEICEFGAPRCVGYVRPEPEACDSLDNDCDGASDEDFDFQNDVNHCGGCTACALPNAIPDCNAGSCEILACLPGYVNSDGNTATGCNYMCTPSGPEVCDGVDNDCDEQVDENLTPPSGLCRNLGTCAGTMPVCGQLPCDPTSPVTWRCIYSGSPEADACGAIPLQEALCDYQDGDCDGVTDETFPLEGTACDDGNIGACQGTGSFICDPMDPTQITCDITNPGQMPGAEVCNDIDDDCNGLVDDGAPDDMVPVMDPMGVTFWIYTYEASRPDANIVSAGSAEHRSCSRPDALPWRNVSWIQAEAACAAAGYRLCTEDEWELSCAGPMNNAYPYGDTYDPYACNGVDYDFDCVQPNDDIALPTGTAYGCPTPPVDSLCVSDFGVYDMSGNVKEWTATQVSAGPPATYRVRGGAYDNIAQGLTCQLDFISLQETSLFPNLGFRCCSDTAP